MILKDGQSNIPTASQSIKQFLIVLALGVLLAIVGVSLGVYYYGPNGSIEISHALLSPDTLYSLNNPFEDKSNKATSTKVFNRIECQVYSHYSGIVKNVPIDLAMYQDIYEVIKNDQNIVKPSQTVLERFNREDILDLLIFVKETGNRAPSFQRSPAGAFQEVQILREGNYFRVWIPDASDGQASWLYFYHEKIGQHIEHLIETGCQVTL